MYPTICKVGPLSILTYGVILAVIALGGVVTLIVLMRSGGDRRRVVTSVLFWVLLLAVLAMIPLMTSLTIHSYGLMMAVAVVLCTFLLARDACRVNIKIDVILDLIFWAIVGGVIGARLFYILLNYSFFAEHPEEIIMIQKGGLAWQGGLILGAVTTVLFIRKRGLFLPGTLDLLAPYLALGQSIGRLGCFLNGCCFGKEVDWGFYFPVHDAHLHPTQLYLSGGLFIIFLVLKRYQRSSQIPGLIFATYLILASSLRFGVEFFRADHEILFLGLSVYQFVCFAVLMFAFGFAFMVLMKHSQPDNT